MNMKCRDPCIGSCGLNSECHVYDHLPQCTCLQGFVGNPFVMCYIQQALRKNYLYLYYHVNNNNNMFLYNKFYLQQQTSKPRSSHGFNVMIIYYILDFKYRYLLDLSQVLNDDALSNKIQCRL